MPAIDDERRNEEAERVRRILAPQTDETRANQRAAEKVSAQKMTAVREKQKTSGFAGLLLLALVVTVLFAVVRYFLGA